MSDFSDRPFVAGSLTGLRAFDVDNLGRLVGPTYHDVFKPGENEARCCGSGTTRSLARLQREVARTSWRLMYGGTDLTPSTGGAIRVPAESINVVDDEPSTHTVGSADCACGFYAYFDGSNTYAATDRVSAIIEGYGVCTVGDRGFRASTAKLVALIDPSARPINRGGHSAWFDRLSDRLIGKYWAAPVGILSLTGGIAAVIASIAAAVEVHPAFATLSILGIAAIVGFGVLLKADLHAIDRKHHVVSDVSKCAFPPRSSTAAAPRVDLALVRRNYPDVPIFPTVEAALAKFPLTPPPQPTPNDDDFWTRPVATA